MKAEDIEPEATKIVAQLIQNERLKQSRWTTGTGLEIASSLPSAAPRNDKGGTAARNDKDQLKDKLKINQEKQSKLTDAYLENLLGEDVYRDKMETLRGEEDGLKKLLAGYELREIESERSEGYLNRVKDFLDGYDDSLQKVSFEHKRQMAGLLFKNIPSTRFARSGLCKIAKKKSVFSPPLIFCGSTALTTGFRKRKRNCNVKRIK